MKNPLITLVAPLTLFVEFRDPHWAISKNGARAWVVTAMLTDVICQYFAHSLSIVSALMSLLTLWWIVAPVRLAHALGGLFTGQALVSLGIVMGLLALGMSHGWVVAAGTVWACWCLAAMLLLNLRYVRTPKSEFITV